jgi:hypothetical protein
MTSCGNKTPVLNRFEAKTFLSFELSHKKIEWRQSTALASLQGSTLEAAPSYLQFVISSLLEQKSIAKQFNVHIQYLCIGEKFLISYDVIHSNGEPLSSTTFDHEDTDHKDQTHFFKSIYESLKTALESTDCVKCLEANNPWWKIAGFIDHDIEITKYESMPDGRKTLAVSMRSCYRRHPYGEYAAVFVLPRFPSSDQFPASPVAMAGIAENGAFGQISLVVLENMLALETAMALPNPKYVFIQGEPGSGKEGFAKAIHFGSRRRDADQDKEPVITRSMAGMKYEEFQLELFGKNVDGSLMPGLIDRAAKKTLFLDEFDKFDRDAGNAPYSDLLRVWEAKEFVRINGRSSEKVDDVNWVVAGAFTSERKTSDLPQDIWSRINTQLTIKSPLSAPAVTDDERTAYIRALILNFMLGNGLKHVDDKRIRGAFKQLKEPVTRTASVVKEILFKPCSNQKLSPSDLMISITNAIAAYLGKYTVCKFRTGRNPIISIEICLPEKLAHQATFVVSKGLLAFDSTGISAFNFLEQRDSIRAVRQACTMIFERLFEHLMQGKKTACATNNKDLEWVKNMLCDGFAAVDVARKGSSPGQFISRSEFQKALFGSDGVLDDSVVEAIRVALPNS